MDYIERLRKRKRISDAFCYPSRKGLFILTFTFFTFLYIVPNIFQWFNSPAKHFTDPLNRCIEDKLTSFYFEVNECNADIRYDENDDDSILPFIGNGYFGISIYPRSELFIKSTRVLSLPTSFFPLINLSSGSKSRHMTVTHFLSGIVHRYHCFENGLSATSYYYAHRKIPFYLAQELKLINNQDYSIDVFLSQENSTLLPLGLKSKKVFVGPTNEEFTLVTGTVQDDSIRKDKVISLCILSKSVFRIVKVKPHESISLSFPTIIYTKIVSSTELKHARESMKTKCFEILNQVKQKTGSYLKEEHAQVWYKLWHSGFGVSHSKATGAINGVHVNATLYYTLSHVRSYLHEINETDFNRNQVVQFFDSHEGCYGGYHHTLQALNLWGPLKTMDEVNKIVSFWLLTLEKQGCYKLTNAGADGVMQAMLLSFGGFRFSSHHLEFMIHPKFLHRDYFFRRISYSKSTFINVSVTVQTNNKAILGVSIEGNNQSFYACDGGCIDDPVEISTSPSYFPVKQTDPVTAILFITPDNKHIELIKHTLHVKEVIEAPAHENHVIAIHKHGHSLGGLPTLFWALVCSLIIIFHLFLFKLIYNEYCGKQDRFKPRYPRF